MNPTYQIALERLREGETYDAVATALNIGLCSLRAYAAECGVRPIDIRRAKMQAKIERVGKAVTEGATWAAAAQAEGLSSTRVAMWLKRQEGGVKKYRDNILEGVNGAKKGHLKLMDAGEKNAFMAQAIDRIAAGESLRRVSVAMGINPKSLRAYAIRVGRKGDLAYPLSELNAAVKDLSKGMHIAEASEKYKFSVQAIEDYSAAHDKRINPSAKARARHKGAADAPKHIVSLSRGAKIRYYTWSAAASELIEHDNDTIARQHVDDAARKNNFIVFIATRKVLCLVEGANDAYKDWSYELY